MLEDAGLEVNDENIFIAGACKEKGIMFLQGKGQIGVRKNEPAKSEAKMDSGNEFTVSVNGKAYAVKLEGDKASVNGKTYDVSVKAGIEKQAAVVSSGAGEDVKAGVPGNVLRIEAQAGTSVNEGDTIMVLEAMKMEIEVKSPKAGVVQSVAVNQGDKVVTGQTLAVVG